MSIRRRQLLGIALVIGLALGGWTTIPATADGGCGGGCCSVTVDCGSPDSHRCCYPSEGEAPCDSSPCGNYCYEKTSCGDIEGNIE